ncbi:hypothetical protein [Kutzneria sp. NPDC051319]|uniref:hypothetical protein n=1 Tax=Kutzneria sp. NPDC051319 TaxID=3155047 RepID=UPI0034458EFA
MSRRNHRYVLIAATVATVMSGAVATAAPAHALGGPIQTFTATSTTLTAVNEISYWPLGPTVLFPVSISRLVNGVEQVVASGKGFVQYTCNGAAVNTYTAVGKELTVPCG